MAANFGIRTGVVWNAYRQGYATINVNAPLSAYNVPVTVTSAGADNVAGTGDDVSLTAFNLDAAHLALAPKQEIHNTPYLDSDYYTWEYHGEPAAARPVVDARDLRKHMEQAGTDRARQQQYVALQPEPSRSNTTDERPCRRRGGCCSSR